MVGSIYGRSSQKSAHFVMIHYQTWPPQAIFFVIDRFKQIFCSETTWPNEPKIVVKAVPNPVKQMSKIILYHTLIKKKN
jgi:hypothetical protein